MLIKNYLFYFIIFFKLTYFERERETAQAEEGQRERETESQASSVRISTKPDVGLELTDHEITT